MRRAVALMPTVLLVAIVILTLGCTSTPPATITTAPSTSASTTTPAGSAQPPHLVNDTVYEYLGDIWNAEYALWRNGTVGSDHVLGQATAGGNATYMVKSIPNQDSSDAYSVLYFNVNDFSLVREEAYSGSSMQRAAEYSPALSFGFPLRHGAPQNLTSKATFYNESNAAQLQAEFNYTLTVQYAGAVQVPMGTFDCYRVLQSFPDSNATFVRYYSPQVGFFVSLQTFSGDTLVEQAQLTRVY